MRIAIFLGSFLGTSGQRVQSTIHHFFPVSSNSPRNVCVNRLSPIYLFLVFKWQNWDCVVFSTVCITSFDANGLTFQKKISTGLHVQVYYVYYVTCMYFAKELPGYQTCQSCRKPLKPILVVFTAL